MSEVVLKAAGLTKGYRQGQETLRVLDQLSLTVVQGEQIAIVGRSGAGKSTLLNLLGGLDRPDQGVVEVMGEDLHRLSERALCALRNRALGFVYQFHHLLPEFSALENVAMPLLIAGESRGQALSRAQELLVAVGLSERLHHRPAALSGGERQRAAIARALVMRPACVLMDEPTGNLDWQAAQAVQQLLKDLNARYGMAMIIVTHDLELAGSLQRQLVLRDGLLVPAAEVACA